MKGLLQSKRFKKNFKKWLCMYVAAILMLTTVVTYSKYISSLGGTDRARITRFNVVIDNETKENYTCATVEEHISCLANDDLKYRPTKDLSYKFNVKPNVEVNTVIATTVYVPKDFEIISLKDKEGNDLYNKETSTQTKEITLGTITNNETGEITSNTITISDKINVVQSSANDTKTYEVIVRYLYDEKKYSEAVKEKVEVIKVGYSAIQDK